MDPTSHHIFETLKISFTATAVFHGYELAASHCFYLPHRLKLATFATPDLEKCHLPHPTYLVMRATRAKIAHLSGAAEHIKKVLRRMEVIHVLAEDVAPWHRSERSRCKVRTSPHTLQYRHCDCKSHTKGLDKDRYQSQTRFERSHPKIACISLSMLFPQCRQIAYQIAIKSIKSVKVCTSCAPRPRSFRRFSTNVDHAMGFERMRALVA